jgi:hypothetical protein
LFITIFRHFIHKLALVCILFITEVSAALFFKIGIYFGNNTVGSIMFFVPVVIGMFYFYKVLKDGDAL